MSVPHSTPEELFWRRVAKSDGCWEWNGYYIPGPRGAPSFRLRGKNRTAYRWALILSGVEVPDAAWVRHTCDNKRCVRPDHLQVITYESYFWEHVNKTETCWLWTGNLHEFGYGKMTIGNKSVNCHRFSWELHNGTITDGSHVLHSCDVPACVNPAHLFLGTARDNIDDMMAKGRQQRGAIHHKAILTEDDVRAIRAAGAAGEVHRRIAERFGIAGSTASGIIRRKTWRHLD